MNAQRSESSHQNGPEFLTNHENAVAVEGLEDLFKWASEMVADGEDARVKRARETRIRRQVLEVVQRFRERKAVEKAADEINYLQRRVMALLQKLTESLEENATIRQIVVTQFFALQRIPELEAEIERLRQRQSDRQTAEAEKKELLNALSRLKTDRDFLDDLLRASEEESSRLSRLLADARAEVDQLRSRRWWHFLLPRRS